MMLSLKLAPPPRKLTLVPAPVLQRRIKPPALKLLPRRTYTRGMLFSGAFHAVAIVAFVWFPALFHSPVVIDKYDHKNTAVASPYEPLILPLLPKVTASDSGAMGSAAPAAPSAVIDSIPLKRDYAGPQEIISDFPNATNRVQTIRRPDLVSPPNLKFPVRLQSMVILPSPAVPKFAPRRIEVQIPIPAATVELPKLVSVPQPVSAIPSEPASAKAAVQPAAVSSPIVELEATQRKAVIVINAVSVAPDPSVQIPDAQLSGNFVVGPSLGTASPPKFLAGDGKSETTPAKNSASASQPYKSASAGIDSNKGAGTSGSSSLPAAGSRNIAGTGVTSGNGTGSGSSTSSHGHGDGGMSGRVTGSSGAGGISISGGSPGRNGGIGSRTVPMSRSYGITIISGGSSGGAGRDMGVFDRSETVFSVAIPMGDVGGGADWPMQYAMLNHGPTGAGMVVPPFAQKKVAATMPRTQLASEQGAVFVSGVIDETGKLQSLRSIRTQDARSQPAIHALQQWQFLPAQLDGRPVASKVLIGVTVVEE
ncbi:MAG: energy transducer TonB [Acidobacteriia bacterium]|nr:energy transducer TonB [Terriglobia bacterium]